MQSRSEIEDKIKAAFKELVLSQPVDKITIKEITDKAGLIRTTFYHHYQDKESRHGEFVEFLDSAFHSRRNDHRTGADEESVAEERQPGGGDEIPEDR